MPEEVIYRKHRKLRNLVVAELKTDTKSTLEYYDKPKQIAGLGELTLDAKSSSEKSYYDDEPRIIIDTEEDKTLKLKISALSLEDRMWLSGQTVSDSNDGFLEQDNVEKPYFAIGYITGDTDGTETYTWIYKGKFGAISESYKTKKGTDSTEDELEFSPVTTNYIFKYDGISKPAVSYKLPSINSKGETTISSKKFFEDVYNPAKTSSTDIENSSES